MHNGIWSKEQQFLAIWKHKTRKKKEREAEYDGRKLKTQRGNT